MKTLTIVQNEYFLSSKNNIQTYIDLLSKFSSKHLKYKINAMLFIFVFIVYIGFQFLLIFLNTYYEFAFSIQFMNCSPQSSFIASVAFDQIRKLPQLFMKIDLNLYVFIRLIEINWFILTDENKMQKKYFFFKPLLQRTKGQAIMTS